MFISEVNNMKSFVLRAIMTFLGKITYDDFFLTQFWHFSKKKVDVI
jgi:hypothetical protein